MIRQLRVQNYKPLRDVTLHLTPIHVLIGPNDSGKTSVLEAIAALCRSVDYPLSQAFAGIWKGLDLVWQRDPTLAITFDAIVDLDDEACHYTLSCRPGTGERQITVENESVTMPAGIETFSLRRTASSVQRIVTQPAGHSLEETDAARAAHHALSGVHSYHWTPSFLGLPVAPNSKRRFRMEPSGFGLGLCLDDILGYDRESFIKLERRFAEIFPHFKSIKLIAEPAYSSPANNPEEVPSFSKSEGKGIYFQLAQSDQPIPASQASDGTLLVLAYLTLLHLPEPYTPRLLLVEEPENGIHPRRLEDVLRILRDLVGEQSDTQVILTTHSPYVVDQFPPDEVTLCRKGEDGSVELHRLSESRTVREQLDVFTLGEIWTGEGDDALVESPPEQEVVD